MPAALPARIAEYLGRLPEGIDSFPNFRVQGTVVRMWLSGHDPAPLLAMLPGPVDRLVRAELAADTWVSEVHATVVYLALRELFFTSDDAFVADAYARNRQLLAGAAFSMMPLLTPANIDVQSRRAFRSMHDGIAVVTDVSRQPWTWSLTFPSYLVPQLLARCYVTALAAALESVGKQAVYVELLNHEPDRIDIALLFEH
ncbi:MAG: hypothetical protein JKY37_13900 [Nannocystaceae bacterium]|nr:hypothetical protein [Nannocystaceae bacterium]